MKRARLQFFAYVLAVSWGCIHYGYSHSCDVGVPLTLEEREQMLAQLRISTAGRELLSQFENQYNMKELSIQWGSASYSQLSTARQPSRNVSSVKKGEGRGPASSDSSGVSKVCISLARDLPSIEHLADFAHELVHATRLNHDVLVGNVKDADSFVAARIRARGGEADAFVTECQIKREIRGGWDSLCRPFVINGEMNQDAVADALYTGDLAASLTGETYPVMLRKQFNALWD
jgi:hypothetical protein